MSELIFRGPTTSLTAYESFTNWENDVIMIEDIQSKGLKGYWWSKCWSTDTSSSIKTCRNDSQPEALKKWRRYALSSYMVAMGEKSYFNWDEDTRFIMVKYSNYLRIKVHVLVIIVGLEFRHYLLVM